MISETRAPDDLDRALGHAIRLRRRSLELTQEQLAGACGISFQQVQKYENGANRVSFSRLVQIARALDCGVTGLMSALDQPQAAPADFECLRLMTLPGAVDLLRRYEAMTPEARRLLVGFLQTAIVEPAADQAPAGTLGRRSGGGRSDARSPGRRPRLQGGAAR